MDGAIFFRSFGLSGVRRLGAWCGRLSSLVSPLPHHHLRPAGRVLLVSGDFFFRPSPSRRLFFACGFQSIPRPRAWDVRTGGRFAAAGGMAVCLLLSCRVALSLSARSLSSCLMFGSSSRASFFSCLPGRVSVIVVGSRPRFAPCSPSRAFPTACLLSAPSHPSGLVGSSPLARPSLSWR